MSIILSARHLDALLSTVLHHAILRAAVHQAVLHLIADDRHAGVHQFPEVGHVEVGHT